MEAVLATREVFVNGETGFLSHYVYNRLESPPLHYHDYSEFFLTMEGETIHTVNGQTFFLPEGSLVLIRPEDCHCYQSRGKKEYSFVNVAFHTEILEMLFAYLAVDADSHRLLSDPMPPTIQLSSREKSALLASLDKLNLTGVLDVSQKKLLFRQVLFDVLMLFLTKYHPASSVPLWLEQAVAEMNHPENFVEGVETFRKLCGKSKEHICRCVREHYGQSPTELINDLRLNYVANRLLSTNKSVAELCYECGFDNISWFYSAFKRKYATTPKRFRSNFSGRPENLNLPK